MNWKGGRRVDSHGYVCIWKPEHPRAHSEGYVYEHLLVAERALGRPVPRDVHVHHINNDRADNRPANLLICSEEYHHLLHDRALAFKETGDPAQRKCAMCKRWDRIENMRRFSRRWVRYYHVACGTEYHRKRRSDGVLQDYNLLWEGK